MHLTRLSQYQYSTTEITYVLQGIMTNCDEHMKIKISQVFWFKVWREALVL